MLTLTRDQIMNFDFDSLTEKQARGLCVIATSDVLPHLSTIKALVAKGFIVQHATRRYDLVPGVPAAWRAWIDTKYAAEPVNVMRPELGSVSARGPDD